MSLPESVQQIPQPLFPGLLDIELAEVAPERVLASMLVRHVPDAERR